VFLPEGLYGLLMEPPEAAMIILTALSKRFKVPGRMRPSATALVTQNLAIREGVTPDHPRRAAATTRANLLGIPRPIAALGSAVFLLRGPRSEFNSAIGRHALHFRC
jgi:hypothetical protein